MDFILNLIIILADQLMLFLVNLMVARRAGEELFGDFSVATNALLLIATLITLGLDSIIAYYVPKLYLRKKFYHIARLTTAIRHFLQPVHLSVFGGGLLLGLSLIALAMVSEKLALFETAHPLLLFIWGTIAISIYNIMVQLFRSIGYMRTAVLLSFMQTIFYFILAIIIYQTIHLVLPEKDVVYFPHMMIVGFLASYFLTVLICFVMIKKIAKPFQKRSAAIAKTEPDPAWRNKMYGYMVQNLNVYVFATIPLLVTEIFGHREDSVGLFAAVVSIISLAFIGLSPIGILIGPEISAALADSKQKLKQTMKKFLWICLSIALVVTAIFGIFAKQILLLYQSKFINALPFLYVCLINIITYSMNMPLSKMIQYSKHGSVLGAKLTTSFIILQTIACVILIKLFGIYGAVTCYIGINILYNITMVIIALRIYREYEEEATSLEKL